MDVAARVPSQCCADGRKCLCADLGVVSCEPAVESVAIRKGRCADALAPIREALAGHPRCDIHPDGDPITCGWKRAVASVQAALDKEDR